jgi:hypothetical protein
MLGGVVSFGIVVAFSAKLALFGNFVSNGVKIHDPGTGWSKAVARHRHDSQA